MKIPREIFVLVLACATAFLPMASVPATAAGMSMQDWYTRIESSRKRAESAVGARVSHIYQEPSDARSAERPRSGY